MSVLETRNPTTGELIKAYEEMSDDCVNDLLVAGHAAFQEWSKTSFSSRQLLLQKVAEILRNNADEYAELMSLEMGKLLKSGVAEIEKCAWCCEFFADNAEQFLAPEPTPIGAAKSYIAFQPLGMVLAIMPWNFPFWQVFRFAAPALMAGNVALLKHAAITTGCGLAIENIFQQAGFPKNVFRTLLLNNTRVDDIIPHPNITAVTLTGSTKAGRIVGQIAGSCVKKVVLELGGSDPYIILEDADIGTAVDLCVASRLTNSGQSCIAAKRFIVVEAVREQFETLFVEKMRAVKMGDPRKPDTGLGPQARFDLRDALHQQVRTSIAKGATCLLGGELPKLAGAFYPATVLTNVKAGMPAYDEELFGPVAAIIPVRDEAEAIAVANDSPYGLGAAVFTQNLAKGEDIAAHKIQAGLCVVNDIVKSDPRMPFGGVKESGYGRELSAYGIKEFVNVKSVVVRDINR